MVWCNYEWAWGGSYQSYYKEQSLNNIAIDKDHLQPLRFQGQFFDQETELHYNRFRYYDTDVGMFIQRDPIGLLGGINIYQYADNPVMWIDPLGLAKGKNNYKVSANTALPDVENRGVHINVSDQKSSMHIEIIGVEVDGKLNLEFKPADPTAKSVSETSKWKKITQSINDFLKEESNREKLANVADAASKNFPNNTRDFKKTGEAIRACV